MSQVDVAAALGSREDPHRQAERARDTPLLIHSIAEHGEILEVIFRHHRPSTVVEIGVESGRVSDTYLAMGADEVHGVDSCPSEELRALFAGSPGLHLVEKTSPEALAELPIADLYVLDGDHNYATVRAELTWIFHNAPEALVVLHDVLWPWARRDLYYEPTPLPEKLRHPRSEHGPSVWHDGLAPDGFVGLGAFTVAVEAGGERNGVLTAIEDSLAAATITHDLHIVPAVFGLAVVVPRGSSVARSLADDLAPWTNSNLLLAMENNRIALYTRILQLQHLASRASYEADSMSRTIGVQQVEIDRLRRELADEQEEHHRATRTA